MKKFAITILAFLFVAGVALRHWPHGSGSVEACVVEDATQRTPAVGAIVASPLVRQACAERAIAWHIVDVNSQGPDLAEVQWAVDAARKEKLPALVIRQGGGNPKTLPLPDTPAKTIAALERYATGL